MNKWQRAKNRKQKQKEKEEKKLYGFSTREFIKNLNQFAEKCKNVRRFFNILTK